MGRKILAGILIFVTIFFGVGYLIGLVTGQAKGASFNLEGWTALLLFALVIVYFVGARYVGGTIWQRILGTRRA
jgi:hypothetical protein